MKKWIVVLSLALLALIAARSAWAFSCTATSCTVEFDYTEPSTLVSGAALTDLTNTVITYQVSVNGGTPGAVKTVTVPASKPAGGGVIAKTVTDTTLVAGNRYVITGATVVATRAGSTTPSAPAAFNTLAIDQTGTTPPEAATGATLK